MYRVEVLLCKIKRCLFPGGYCLGSSLADEPLCPKQGTQSPEAQGRGREAGGTSVIWQRGAVLEEMLHRVSALSLVS